MVIRPAEKGGGLVILTRDYYYSEMQGLLEDATTYLPINGNPTAQLKVQLYKWIDEGLSKQILNPKRS